MPNVINTGSEAIYDTGYTSYYHMTPVKLACDDEVVELYNKAAVNPSLYNNHEFRERVMRATTRLIFPLDHWLMATRSNHLLTKHCVLLARDLALVAMGSRRELDLAIRMRLADTSLPMVKSGNGNYANVAAGAELITLGFVDQIGKVSPAIHLAYLTAKPSSLKDTLTTLYVMFGKVPAKPRK